MKMLLILTTADIRAVGPGVWNSWKAQLLRTLYYETEPALTGGFSEVDRAKRVAMAQAEFRAEMKEWIEGGARRLHRAALSGLLAQGRPAAQGLARELPQIRAGRRQGGRDRRRLRHRARRHRADRARARPSAAAVGDRRRLRGGGRNIVDAQIFTTTDGLALDTIAVSREFEHNEDEARRAVRIADSIERALARRTAAARRDGEARRAQGRLKAFAIEPEVMINNQWSNRYTVVEVTGLDRPGLLYELTATISKLILNIASAHVATFGERVVDVFYVTDLLGAQITSPSRQAAIKRALLPLFAEEERKPAKAG